MHGKRMDVMNFRMSRILAKSLHPSNFNACDYFRDQNSISTTQVLL
jgi:hypothetical protein